MDIENPLHVDIIQELIVKTDTISNRSYAYNCYEYICDILQIAVIFSIVVVIFGGITMLLIYCWKSQ
jgi:hypothetical protein